jgi:hypothetical protein
LNLLLRYWKGRAGLIPLPGRSCDFSLLDNVFWDYFTEDIYIWTFCVLLMERHTEIEYVMRHAVFWDCTQHKVVIPFWYFGLTSRYHLQGSRCPRRTCLGTRLPSHTWCLLEELTVTEFMCW